MNDNERQLRNKILNSDPIGSGNLCISAGAGAGKTTLLAGRIARQIAHGDKLESFAIITYTNAATAEMYAKLEKELRELLKKAAGTEKQNVEKALENLESVQISTIHAFLLRILRENAFESGVTVDAVMLEDDEDKARKNRWFNEWYRIHYKDVDVGSAMAIEDKSYNTLRDSFISMADERGTIPVYELPDMLHQNVISGQKLVNHYLELGSPVINDKPKEALTIISEFDPQNADAKSISDLANALDLLWEKTWFRKKKENETASEELIKWLKDNYEDYFTKDCFIYAPMIKAILPAVKAYQEYVDAVTTELSNNDILYRAQQLIKNCPKVLEKVQKKYTRIYVDEFQDTSALQADIVKCLACEPGTVYADCRKEKFKQDCLVTVGDPKQSIYRFAGAELAVYEKFRDNFAEEERVELSENFRSGSDIVEAVNTFFGDKIKDYKEMTAANTVGNESAGCISGFYKMNLASNQAEQAAALILDLKKNQKIYDHDDQSARGVVWKDIMVLTKTTTDMQDFITACQKADIPVHAAGKWGLGHVEVLQRYVRLLRGLANYKNKTYAACAGQVLTGRDAVLHAKDNADTLFDLSRELIWGRKLEPTAVARYIAERPVLYAPHDDRTISEQEWRDAQVKILQMLETCFADYDGDLLALCDAMETYIDKKIDREIALDPGEDAIRLMNVHKAKGLTGNVVIIADGYEKNLSPDGFKQGDAYYPCAVSVDERHHNITKYPTYDKVMQDVSIQQQEEEKVRLRYVALTRAANACIILPNVPNPRKGTQWMKPFLDTLDRTYPLEGEQPKPESGEGNTSDETASQTAEAPHIVPAVVSVAKVLAAQDFDWSQSANVISVTPSRQEAKGVTGFMPGDAGYVDEKRPNGAAFGTVMHRVFELLVLRRTLMVDGKGEQKVIKACIRQAIAEYTNAMYDLGRAGDATAQEAADFKTYLEEKVPTFWMGKLAPALYGCDTAMTEYDFSFIATSDEIKEMQTFLSEKIQKEINANPNADVWVNGKADLIVVKGDTVTVYDYKSDGRNGKDLGAFQKAVEDKYHNQLELYKFVMRKIYPDKEISAQILHLYDL